MRRLIFFLIPLSLSALEVEPWFSDVWEFNFTPSYTYSRYRDVQNGHPQLSAVSNDHLIALNLSVSPAPPWEIAADMEFAETPRQSMGFRSTALQGRYLWLNDVMGDSLSLTTGVSLRAVGSHSLKDVSSPYHFHTNYELNTSIGREWNRGFDWFFRLYGFGAVGIANRGYPWTRALMMLEGSWHEAHRLGLSGEGYFGFGNRSRVMTDHFNGYAFLRHRSLDVGLQYTYVFEIWGRISLVYTRRLYAQSFPENVNFFTLRYILPFSAF